MLNSFLDSHFHDRRLNCNQFCLQYVICIRIKEISEFVDNKFALFNFDKQEDTARAIEDAEKDAIKQINKMGSMDFADEQAKNIIKGIFSEVIEKGYELEFEKID